MDIKTKKVQGRRKVHYESMDDLFVDAQNLAGQDVQTLGNWSQGQIYAHLATTLNGSIDGMDFKLPAPVRWMMTLLMKNKFLYKDLPAGFKSTSKFIPDQTSVEEGWSALEKAIARQKTEPSRVMHPGFGNLTREEWTAFHLRHAEMHMSFLVEK